MAKLPKALSIGEWQTVTNFVREHKAEDVALLIIQYEREIGGLKAKIARATKKQKQK